MNSLVWIELSKSAFNHNIEIFKNTLGESVLLAAVVKSNAYGHGLIEIAKLCEEYGVDWLCVNSIDEGVALRKEGISKPILIIGYVEKGDLERLVEYNLSTFLYDREIARELKEGTKVHVKVDTGMHRQGIMVEEFEEFLNFVSALKGITVEGVATHFATSDRLKDPTLFKQQLAEFTTLPIAQGILRHCANSAAALVYPESHLDMVRAGISLYGFHTSEEVYNFCLDKNIELQSVLSLKTKIVQTKKLKKGESVGYGATYVADKNMDIAILPIGYYDGLDRRLSNRGSVLIGGKRAPIIGRVCMNLSIVDISDNKDVRVGDEVVIIGRQGNEEIHANELAKLLDTINYEIVTRLRESTEKRVVD